jgi:two-component system OmpR family response regulator
MAELRRILVVDDAADIRMLARLALERVGGFEVRLCEAGEDALAAAREFRPDMVLLDVMMPGWDGPRTLAAFRSDPEFSGLPCAFFTARQEAGEVERLRSLGCVGLITKPFDAMKLASQVRDLWPG